MSLKPNARSIAIGKVLKSTVTTANEGISSASDAIKDSLSSMKKSLTSKPHTKTDNPLFAGVVPKGGKRISKKRKSRKHRKTAKK